MIVILLLSFYLLQHCIIQVKSFKYSSRKEKEKLYAQREQPLPQVRSNALRRSQESYDHLPLHSFSFVYNFM